MDAANVLLPIKAGEPKPVDIGQGMPLPQRDVAVQCPNTCPMESMSIFHQPAGTARCGGLSLAQALASWWKLAKSRSAEMHAVVDKVSGGRAMLLFLAATCRTSKA